jgi:hypothetical protein
MDSRTEDDAGDSAGNLAEDAENVSPILKVEDEDQENHILNQEEGDAVGLNEERHDANDAQIQQAGETLTNDQQEGGDQGIEFAAVPNLAHTDESDMDTAEMNQNNDAANSLQDEVNELKIELLSSHRNLDEANERELRLQKQLDELSKQQSAEARASADKISRLENRIVELQHQLEDASRQQQPSPSSDLRIRAAEVQELKARIKQYEIKLASSEEISSIRKEAEMERVRTDASWQHRMLSDQVT